MKYNNLILFSISLIFSCIFFTVFDVDSQTLLFLLSLFCYLILFLLILRRENINKIIFFPIVFLALFFGLEFIALTIF